MKIRYQFEIKHLFFAVVLLGVVFALLSNRINFAYDQQHLANWASKREARIIYSKPASLAAEPPDSFVARTFGKNAGYRITAVLDLKISSNQEAEYFFNLLEGTPVGFLRLRFTNSVSLENVRKFDVPGVWAFMLDHDSERYWQLFNNQWEGEMTEEQEKRVNGGKGYLLKNHAARNGF